MTWFSFEDWVADARGADIVEVAARLGAGGLKPQGRELVGPCPGCGGTDRFSINPMKRLWNCGHEGGAGGDVVALVGHVLGLSPADGRDFVRICEEINGAPPPDRESAETAAERAARLARRAEQAARAAEDERARAIEAQDYRDAEIGRARAIWDEAFPIQGTAVEAYLAARGIRHIAGLRLRCAPRLGYFVAHPQRKGTTQVATLPAMVAAIVDPSGAFSGVHLTYLDAECSAKATIVNPFTSAPEPAKKIRGSVHGAVVRLAGPVADPCRLVCGEGVETTLSVRDDAIDGGLDIAATAWWAGISLGNIGGKATETVRHPTGVTKIDKAGRARVAKISGPVPAPDSPGIVLPETVTEALLLGDGDSDPATTDFALRRCAARWARPGLTVRRAWARDGEDFNDMRRAS